MNVREFLEGSPRVGTKVIVHLPVEVDEDADGPVINCGVYLSLRYSNDPDLDYEVTIPEPELPTKLGAVVEHGEYGKCVLARPGKPDPWIRISNGCSYEAIQISTGTFTILGEGVDE